MDLEIRVTVDGEDKIVRNITDTVYVKDVIKALANTAGKNLKVTCKESFLRTP